MGHSRSSPRLWWMDLTAAKGTEERRIISRQRQRRILTLPVLRSCRDIHRSHFDKSRRGRHHGHPVRKSADALRYSFKPARPSSRPMPDWRIPPKGTAFERRLYELTQLFHRAVEEERNV